MVKQRARSFLGLTTPLQVWGRRFAFLLLVLAAASMIILNRAGPAFLESFRTAVADTLEPVLDALSRPAAAIGGIGDSIKELAGLREENQRLKKRVAELEGWRSKAARLEAQNTAFRAMLNFVPDAPSRYVSARIVADSSSAFVRSVLINAGRAHGVRKGQAALASAGLVGRVADLGERSARVLLLTDFNSRIPVIVESTRERAVLAGNNTAEPKLLYLPATAEIRVGSRIVTSGHGGVFPPGLPVGVVSSVTRAKDGAVRGVRVRAFVKWNRLENIRIISYDPKGLVARQPDSQAAARGK